MPDCDTSKGLVAIDSLGAIGLGVGGLAALGEDEGVGAVALVGAALFTAAALHGSGNADKCRAALAEYSLEVSGGQPAMEVRRTPKKRRPEPEPESEAEPEPVKVARPTAPPKPTPEEGDPAEPTPEPAPRKPEPGARDWSQFWREVP